MAKTPLIIVPLKASHSDDIFGKIKKYPKADGFEMWTANTSEKKIFLKNSPDRVEWIDVRRLRKPRPKGKYILSYHQYSKTPSLRFLQKKARSMKKTGADIIKIACMTNELEDTETLIQLALELSRKKIPHIVIGMGKLGILTRIMGSYLGNVLTYASGPLKTAPGQLSYEETIKISHLIRK